MDTRYCNLCGKVLDMCDEHCDFVISKEFIGYGSKYDGDAVELRLCCECFDAIVDACHLNPIIDNETEG